MKKLIVSLVALALLLIPTVPASAHFQRGGNCHFEDIRRNGTIVMRITNRTGYAARVTCWLNFNVGRDGYMYANLAARTWRVVRHRFYGQWTRATINHVHVTRL